MQRITSLAVYRELGGFAASSAGICAWKRGLTCAEQPALHRQWAGVWSRPYSVCVPQPKLCRRSSVISSRTLRLFSDRSGADEPPQSSGGQPAVSVVGIPDPITWIRCKVIMYLIYLYFELDINSEEFEKGAKQALIHISSLMSSGRYHRLEGIVSSEMIDYVQTRCRSLTGAQRQQLSVTMDDIIFMLPEDVSVVFDQYGRKFCFIVMRFWLLSTYEGPDDPEGTKIFKVASSEDGSPQKKIVTAVYEFKQELTRGASPDWTVTTVWHWLWKLE